MTTAIANTRLITDAANIPLTSRTHPKVASLAKAPATDTVHPGVFMIMVGAFALMFLVLALTFRGDTEASFAVVVSIGYAVIYFTIPWISAYRGTGAK